MLAPSPNAAFSAPAARADASIVAGEDAPVWLATAFAVAGTLVAIMSAALWQQAPAAPQVVAAIPAPQPIVAEPPRRPPEPPAPLPALIVAPPLPLPSATPAEPPAAPTTPTARAEPPSAAKASTECFAPLAIAFERGSTRPNPADMKRSRAILQKALSRHVDATLVIEGHADASGSEDLNVLLSYSRAKAVAELLRKDGIPAQQIAVRAAGAGAAHGDAEAVAADRKAVLRIAGVDDCDQLTAVKRP
jgi:outer membrane protein OmpA-like peptidoglycan-associated protein